MASNYLRKTITHEGLHKSKTITADSSWELKSKCQMQYALWEEQWENKKRSDAKKQAAEQKRKEKEEIARNNEAAVQYAQQQTNEAEDAQARLDRMLLDSIQVKKMDFNDLKDYSEYPIPYPPKCSMISPTREPLRSDEEFNPKPSFFAKLSSKKMSALTAENDALFAKAHERWEKQEYENQLKNDESTKRYNEEVEKWFKERTKFKADQKEKNDNIDFFANAISTGDADSVVQFLRLLMDQMVIPLEFDRDFNAEYLQDNRTIIIDARFPSMENIPRLKSVSYIKSRQEFKESFYTDNQVQKKYDDAIYKLVLIYLKYVFSINTYFDLVDAVVLNGIVNSIDKSTGNNADVCVLSVREKREDFSKLNLAAIDPKAWFRSSKGIAAASIANVTPVQPIQIINKEDHRFIEGYSVIDSVDEGVNLASIDWQDFENLIRELFGQEFSSNGGEVKITQASRDGGVDAVAFDPDPIRGGKIVIQAKRYTNVVGVSAVRDLYGTLLNEGAMKGILVTTSHFGNDAYDFANGKPIQLIDGAQLLGLLEKHGHKARINLKEAKAILKGTT